MVADDQSSTLDGQMGGSVGPDRVAQTCERQGCETDHIAGEQLHGQGRRDDEDHSKQDELPGTPNAGQTVCSAFDVSDPQKPVFIAQIPLGNLTLPSGALRNKKSINLVYVRVGAKGQTA